MQIAESKQENDSEEKEEENTIKENIVSNTNEFQIRTNRRLDAVSAVLVLVTILVGFFLYRKYNSKTGKNAE